MRTLTVVLLLAGIATPAAARVSTDLDVGWISRLPEIDYVVDSTNPRVEGWPAVGSDVIWRAHVRNWSDQPLTARYEWRLDGNVIATGTASFAPNADSGVDLHRPWSFDRHLLDFRVDSDDGLAEESEKNNEVSVFTDALAVGFWVEQSFYDVMRENQQKLPGVGSASFEDWAERIITKYNEIAAIAIYPEAPDGVLDRWRLQKVVVVPDGALPLVPIDPSSPDDGNANSHPDDADRTIDMSWGFTAQEAAYFNDFTSIQYNPFYLNSTIIHELGHARYLIDVYAFSVKHVPPLYQINIKDNGTPVVGNEMPASGLILNGVSGFDAYETWDSGLMVYDYDWIDRYSAAALNLIAGSRAVSGTANEPKNYAVFLNDLPAQNRITIRDSSGNPIPNATVDLFRGVRESDDIANPETYLSRIYDNTADLHYTTDANGQIMVGRNPFTANGAFDGYRLGEVTAILRVRNHGANQFGFLESRLFNLAYWGGAHDFADHDVYVNIRCSDLRPGLTSPAFLANVTGPVTTLKWNPVRGADSYNVWISANGAPPMMILDHALTDSATTTATGNVRWWVEANYSVACPARRSLTYQFTTPPPTVLPRKRSSTH